jgi:hypothetical protein
MTTQTSTHTTIAYKIRRIHENSPVSNENTLELSDETGIVDKTDGPVIVHVLNVALAPAGIFCHEKLFGAQLDE